MYRLDREAGGHHQSVVVIALRPDTNPGLVRLERGSTPCPETESTKTVRSCHLAASRAAAYLAPFIVGWTATIWETV